MSPRAKSEVGRVPDPSVRRVAKTAKKPAMWRAWGYVRVAETDAKARLVEGTSTASGDAGKAEATSRYWAAAERLVGQSDAPKTFGMMAESWISWRRLRESSRTTYRNALNTSLAPLHGQPVADITPGALFDLLSSLSPGAVRTAYAVMRGAFSRSVALGLISASPATTAVLPQAEADANRVRRRLTVVEVQELRDLFREASGRKRASIPLFEVSELILRTGARIGEVLALRVEHIERELDLFSENPSPVTLVTITGTQVGAEGALHRQEHTKTGLTGRRKVRVSEAFYGEHVAPLTHGRDRDDWLFQARVREDQKEPQMVSAANLRRAWRATLKGTKFEAAEVTPHTYRRTVAQALVDEGQSELAVALLGHATARTLFRSYAEQAIPVVNPAALLDGIFDEVSELETDADMEAFYGFADAGFEA